MVSILLATVGAIVLLGLSTKIFLKNQVINDMRVKRTILNLRLRTLAKIGDQANWQIMVNSAKNKSFACLIARTCKNGSMNPPPHPNGQPPTISIGNFVTPSFLSTLIPLYEGAKLPQGSASTLSPQAPVPSPTPDPLQTPAPQINVTPFGSNFSLYDLSGNLEFDALDKQAGFKFDGSPCSGFSLNGSDDCPIRMDLQWTPSCENQIHPGSCSTPEELIAVSFTYAPKSNRFMFTFNPDNYNVTMERLVTGSNVPILRCAQNNLFFIGNFASGPTNFRGYPSDAAGCINLTALQGKIGPEGPTGPMGPQGPPGCPGPSPGGGSSTCVVSNPPPNQYCTASPLICGLFFSLMKSVPNQAAALYYQALLTQLQAQGLTAAQAVAQVTADMMQTPQYIKASGGTPTPAQIAASTAAANAFMAATGTTGAECTGGTSCGAAGNVTIPAGLVNSIVQSDFP
jgi:hypothetical protein